MDKLIVILILFISLFLYCRNKTEYPIIDESPDVNKILKKVRHNHIKISQGVSIGGHIGAHSSGIVASTY